MGFYQRHRRLATLFDPQHDDRIWATLSPEQQRQARTLLCTLLAEIIHHVSPPSNTEINHARRNHAPTSQQNRVCLRPPIIATTSQTQPAEPTTPI